MYFFRFKKGNVKNRRIFAWETEKEIQNIFLFPTIFLPPLGSVGTQKSEMRRKEGRKEWDKRRVLPPRRRRRGGRPYISIQSMYRLGVGIRLSFFCLPLPLSPLPPLRRHHIAGEQRERERLQETDVICQILDNMTLTVMLGEDECQMCLTHITSPRMHCINFHMGLR